MLKFVRTNLRRKILQQIVSHPQTDFYVRELATIIREDPGNTSRELKRFESEGIVVVHMRARAKFYSLNENYPQLDKLKDLLSKEEERDAQAKNPSKNKSKIKSDAKHVPILYLCATNLRRRLLTYVLQNPTKEFYVREMATFIGEDPGNLSRELRVFEEEGLFESYTRAKARFYVLRQDHELCRDLRVYLLEEKDNRP